MACKLDKTTPVKQITSVIDKKETSIMNLHSIC